LNGKGPYGGASLGVGKNLKATGFAGGSVTQTGKELDFRLVDKRDNTMFGNISVISIDVGSEGMEILQNKSVLNIKVFGINGFKDMRKIFMEPVEWGYSVFCRPDTSGFHWKFKTHCGKCECD
jgi:hypothetical protein